MLKYAYYFQKSIYTSLYNNFFSPLPLLSPYFSFYSFTSNIIL